MCSISLYLTVSQSLVVISLKLIAENSLHNLTQYHWDFQYYYHRYIESAWFVAKQSYDGAFNLPCNVYFMQTKG